ncbi:MAG: hypothetical protein IPK64_07965 [bacterium]|nr:hypothetical protein [bacterium]
MRAFAPVTPVVLLAALLGYAGAAANVVPLPGTEPLPTEIARRLAERAAPLRDEARAVQPRRLPGEKAPDALETIVISCDFADSLLLGRHSVVPGDFPPPRQTDRHYDAHDSTFLHHKLQDVAAYYADVSGGALEVRFTVHPRAINLPQPMSWYGNHPDRGEQTVAMAAAVIDSLDGEIDFTRYDTVVLVHAGAGEETDILGDSPEQIYSTYLDPADFQSAFADGELAQPYIPALGFAAGTGIDRVLVLPETAQQDPYGLFGGGFGSLGLYCFEFGLHLGMLSLSDFTPAGRPDSQGVGQYDLMGYGLFVGLGYLPPQPGPFNKLLMGWLDPESADPDIGGTVTLLPAAGAHGLACARIDITGQEYWLAEYRLQDPNGDRRFSFPGDLNGNGFPDFWDADSRFDDGTPTGKFDPATDIHEDLRGAEWDFAMSENNARRDGELGFGSGIYIWHVDEAVVARAFGQATNLFNANPARKAVDLEEADGIQDLDTNEPSNWQLGGDHDSFRGEGNARFGPDTRPDTRSNAGLPTGIVMSGFSDVVLDSAAYMVQVGDSTYAGFDYADAMTFSLARLAPGDGMRLPAARVTLPAGTDLSGSHLLAVDLDGAGTGEIVAADRAGGVWVFRGDLTEFLDHDGDPATIEPFAAGRSGGAAAAWLLPAAAGDLDGNGTPDIVVATGGGVHAFGVDGQPLRALAPGDNGLYAEVPGCNQPVVLVPVAVDAVAGEPTTRVDALVAWSRDGVCGLDWLGGVEGTVTRTLELGSGYIAAPPQLAGSWLACTIADTLAGTGRLAVVDLARDPLPAVPEFVEIQLLGVPGSWPPVLTPMPGDDAAAPHLAVLVLDREGAGEGVVLGPDLTIVGRGRAWPSDLRVHGPPGPGGAVMADGRVGRVGQAGDWLDGWPRTLAPAAVGAGASALVARLVDAPQAGDHYLFTANDGRLIARGARGEEISGWPLQGPAAAAGTPAIGDFGGGTDQDLASVGTFRRVIGNAEAGAALVTVPFAEIVVWHDVAAAARWPMWGGSAWRSGDWDRIGFVGVPTVAAGTGLVPGSHFCYPNPLNGEVLRARAQTRGPGRARVTVHDLAGEQLAATDWRDVAAVEPFAIEVPLPGVASGMYFCRLVVVDGDGRTESSVVTFAVER